MEIDQNLKSQNLMQSEMLVAAFNFWFSDKEPIRSPFPDYIREPLRMKALDNFSDWMKKIPEKAKKEINAEIMAEKFEEILFETALPMVLTEDERITLRYPFMMRLGDIVNVKEVPEEKSSTVIDRSFLKRGDLSFMKVKLKNTSTGKVWEREFELPE